MHYPADMKARHIGIDNKTGHTVTGLVLGGTGKQDAEIRMVGATDKNLGAIKHPVIAILYGTRLDGPTGVGAARGFG